MKEKNYEGTTRKSVLNPIQNSCKTFCTHFLLTKCARLLPLCIALLFAQNPEEVRAGYKSMKVKLEPAKSYPFHQMQGAITIAADPYESRNKIKTAFDLKELDQFGIVPVHIIISNEGEDTISIDGNDINLLDYQNRSLAPMPVDEVVRLMVNKGSPGATRGPTTARFPIPRGEGRRGDAFEIETDFNNKSLKETRVSPHSTTGGFIFFRLPENRMRLGGYKVYVPEIKNLKTQKNMLFFEIELK